MNPMLTKILALASLWAGTGAWSDIALTPNLVPDGGMEQWREVPPEEPRFNELKRLRVSYTGTGKILMPSGYEQGGISVVQREEKDVCSGKYSLRLKADSFYMYQPFEGAYAARRGDVYVVRFMAKGQGSATMYLTVYGGGAAYTLEQKGAPVPDKWTLIEQRILVGGASPDRIYPRLATSAEMLIDDVFIGRVLREDEASAAKKVPKEYDERVAFAPAAAAPPVIDGKLDDECWKAAVPFSGFRLSHEQTLLAPDQACFRALHDEKAIYLGVEMALADAERVLNDLKSKPLKEDTSGDFYTARHSVEIFLQPPGQGRYIQCCMSLDGYRFDGTGPNEADAAWNGQWKHGVGAAKDRWFLELMIPASDLNLDRIASAEGWRLNLVDNRDGNYATWAAVGNNFHNPFAFGAMVTKDFPRWRREKNQEWTAVRKKLSEQADTPGLNFRERLERTKEFSAALPAPADETQMDWQAITRSYALMNFVDAAYRAMGAESLYARLFARN